MRKIRAVAVYTFLFALLGLVGCAGKIKEQEASPAVSAAFNEPVYEWGDINGKTITFWAKDRELERNYIKKAFKRYESATGNKIDILNIPADSYEETLVKTFTGEDMGTPDIIVSYGGTNIKQMDPDANFYDFSDAEWIYDLTTTSINQTIYNGKVIGLPHWEASVSGTLYNKSLFEKYKIAVPTNQKEFLEVCEILLSKGIVPMYLPYAESSMLLYQFPLDTLLKDTETLNSLNNGTLNYTDIPEMHTIVEWYKTMTDRGYFGENLENNDWEGMNEALESDKYAMMLCWDTWLYTDFQGDASKFGLMPAFMGVPERGTFEGPNLSLFIVNKNSENIDAALDFITFMADPYNYNVAFEGIYTAPVFKRQIKNISTPQYAESERIIERLFHDSTAWLRIEGFSQTDAAYIQKYMQGALGYTIDDCLNDMDSARKKRTLK